MEITKEEEKVILYCRRCNSREISNKYAHIRKEYKSEDNKLGREEKIPVIEEVPALPSTKIPCKECGNDTAYWWIRQTRSSDEPETRFYRCSKCHYTWREY